MMRISLIDLNDFEISRKSIRATANAVRHGPFVGIVDELRP